MSFPAEWSNENAICSNDKLFHCTPGYPGCFFVLTWGGKIKMQKVNYVICGAFGYMGSSGLNGIRLLLPILREIGITANLIALIDVGLDAESEGASARYAKQLKSIREFCKASFPTSPIICGELGEFGNMIEMIKRSDDSNHPIIVYDATPVNVHFDTLNYVSKLRENGVNIHYFGEKPLFTDPAEIRRAKNLSDNGFEFFCDFIETKNLTTLAIKDFLKCDEEFVPDEIWLWRAGSSGVKKFIGADRPGVAGGAHMDKMPHDLSITVSLLGAENIESWQVANASIDYVCLGGNATDETTDTILNSTNASVANLEFDFEQRSRLPADATSSFDVVWKLKNERQVTAHYASSWIGVLSGLPGIKKIPAAEREVVGLLEKAGFIPQEWLNEKAERGPVLEWGMPPSYKGVVSETEWKHDFIERQARICVVRSGERYLFGNFYHKHSRAGDQGAEDLAGRWLYEVDMATKVRKKIPIYEDMSEDKEREYFEVKGTDFTRLLASVTRAILSGTNEPDVGSPASLIVHSVLLEAYDQVMSNLKSQKCSINGMIEEVAPIYRQYVRSRV
jgi:predicted dehydrogenase